MSSVCSRLHAIGVPCEFDRTASDQIADMAQRSRRHITCPNGEYRIWQSPQGAQVWFHYGEPAPVAPPRQPGVPGTGPQPGLRQTAGPQASGVQPQVGAMRPTAAGREIIDRLTGMSVFHRGVSDIRCRLDRTRAVAGPDRLTGVCTATMEAIGGKRRGRRAALSFEHLGFGADAFEQPMLARVQIVGLAQKIWAFPDDAAYLRATPSDRLIGVGALTHVEPHDIANVGLVYRPNPGTLWLITGIVKRSMPLDNPVTGTRYVWMLVGTDRGDIDLIANPAVIQGDISSGHVLQTVAVMTGRIIARA